MDGTVGCSEMDVIGEADADAVYEGGDNVVLSALS